MIILAPEGKTYLPHQLKCIRYAMGGRGSIVADEMGLGKTIESIGVINATTQGVRNDVNVVIICPAFLKLNWHNELDAWMVNSCKVSVLSYHEADGMAKLIMNGEYGKQQQQFIDILIIDEAHYIKNPETQRAQNVERIALYAKRVLALTGTPMENRPIELWQLLKIVCGEKWNPNPRIGVAPSSVLSSDRKQWANEGPSFWEFAERYCDLRYVSYDLGHGRTKRALDFGGASNLEELGKRLRETCMVRRLKKDVLPDLPDIRRQLIVLESKANDADLFPNLSDETYYDVLSKLRTDKVVFSEWSRRRHDQALQKVDACLRFIGDALDESDKIVVFAHHTDVIARLASGIACEFRDNAYSVAITGATPMAEREKYVKAFQTDPMCRVIVGSLGAMGVGFNLSASQHVICVELDPVPGRMSQAESRPHRIGQKGSLLVQHLLANGSLCARMAKILVRKQAHISAVLDLGKATLTSEESSENGPLP
jgi:SWI/SNF-related matrix-associated actin-dependent regulator of chromatin subfamily A-like protein 1